LMSLVDGRESLQAHPQLILGYVGWDR